MVIMLTLIVCLEALHTFFDSSSSDLAENTGNSPVLNDYTLNPNGSSAD